ncbi:MAG: sodium:calcium antiporter [Planctomycetota bacterium]
MLPLVASFLGLAAIVAAAGTILARSADRIAEGTGLGRLLVGSVLLAAATSLPELSVDIAAVRAGTPDLAVGDLFGSSLMNLLILAGIDLAQRSAHRMLSREAASHALSATLAIALTALAALAVLTAGRLPSVTFVGIGGWSWAILAAWLLGARMLFIDQRISARAAMEAAVESGVGPAARPGLARPAVAFATAAVVLVVAGPRLAAVADQLAHETGLGRTFVGTTLVALTTSLPELVASVAAVRMGAFDLAIGNTFGSNAFNMVLFMPLDALYPGSLFAGVNPAHAVTALAVIVATAAAVLGQLYHEERRLPILEPDAVLVVLVVVGALALVYRLS